MTHSPFVDALRVALNLQGDASAEALLSALASLPTERAVTALRLAAALALTELEPKDFANAPSHD
jgi:hypothetical protein